MTVGSRLARALRRLIRAVFETLEASISGPVLPLAGFIREVVSAALGIDETAPVRPIDQRLAKLDAAKSALQESLEAIQELQLEASNARIEHAAASSRLETILETKGDEERKLNELRAFYARDMSTLRELTGAPNQGLERVLAFFLGVGASLIASVLWAFGPVWWRWVGTFFGS